MSTIAIPSFDASQPTLCTLPSRLVAIRKNLVDSGFYLGDKSVLDNVHWVRDGRADRLAVKPATVTDGDSADANGTPVQKYPTPPPEGGIELAPLCAVVQISHDDFWLTSDAGYRSPSQVWKSLANVKPSCTVEEPDMQPMRGDFQNVIGNIRQLQEKISTPGYQLGKGFLAGKGIFGQRIKVRHMLFEPRHTDADDEGETAVESSNSEGTDDNQPDTSVFSIDDWPLTEENTRSELLDLKATHSLVPIPAYDINGNLIKPDAYRRCLQDALVELHFNLSHWSIAGKKGSVGNDVFTGDIHMIRVISPPRFKPVASSPRKRKISLFVDPSGTPPKKARHN